jgi:hypothetical protein
MPYREQDIAASMRGATRDMKARLRQELTPDEYDAVRRAAAQILKDLPTGLPLGSTVAALFLAATSHAEGATHADKLLEER